MRAADSRVDGNESRSRGSNTDTSKCSTGVGYTGKLDNAGMVPSSFNLAVEGGQDPPEHGEDGGHIGQKGDG